MFGAWQSLIATALTILDLLGLEVSKALQGRHRDQQPRGFLARQVNDCSYCSCSVSCRRILSSVDARPSWLPRNLQRRILETQVTVFLIQENTPPEVKFNIFKRINTGGLPLSSQEIRHALNQGKATELLQRLAESPEFRLATNEGIRDDRMGDRECVLRLLAFMTTRYRDYKSNALETFLNQCMVMINGLSDHELDHLHARFQRTMVDCYRIFADRAFRKEKRGSSKRYPINRALYEVWAANIEALSSHEVDVVVERKESLKQRFVSLLEESDFEAAISVATGDPKKVRLRFSKIEEIVRETLQ